MLTGVGVLARIHRPISSGVGTDPGRAMFKPDEGKGKTVDFLAEQVAMVVRYQGGDNAGHTVVVGDENHDGLAVDVQRASPSGPAGAAGPAWSAER